MATCSSQPSQQWTFTANNAIQPVGNSNYCVDLNGNNFTNPQITLWTCNSGNNQQWILQSDNSIKTPLGQNLCLVPSTTAQNSPLTLQTCAGQSWTT